MNTTENLDALIRIADELMIHGYQGRPHPGPPYHLGDVPLVLSRTCRAYREIRPMLDHALPTIQPKVAELIRFLMIFADSKCGRYPV